MNYCEFCKNRYNKIRKFWKAVKLKFVFWTLAPPLHFLRNSVQEMPPTQKKNIVNYCEFCKNRQNES